MYTQIKKVTYQWGGTGYHKSKWENILYQCGNTEIIKINSIKIYQWHEIKL